MTASVVLWREKEELRFAYGDSKEIASRRAFLSMGATSIRKSHGLRRRKVAWVKEKKSRQTKSPPAGQKAILLKVKINGRLFARYLRQHFPKVFKNGTIRSKEHNEQQA